MSDASNPMAAGRPVPLDDAWCAEVIESLRKRHRQLRDHDQLVLSGELAHGHGLVELRMTSGDTLLSIDVAVECEPNDIDEPLQARDLALNYLDTALGDYLANDRTLTLLPVWDLHDVDGVGIKIRGEVTRPALESEADRLLREAGFEPDGTQSNDGEPN